MGESFVTVLLRKIEERQRLESRPMGTLTPKLHPAEVMELQLLARPLNIKIHAQQKPYGPANSTGRTSTDGITTRDTQDLMSQNKAAPEPALPLPMLPKADPAASARPTPKLPLGIQEMLAREVFIKWGAELENEPLAKELTKAYRKLAFRLHPDRSCHPEAGAIFSDITAAYEVLKAWAKKAY